MAIDGAADGAPAAATDTLDQLLTRAVERDPRLVVVEARAEATAAQVGQARAALLPRLSATAGYTRNAYASEVELPGEDPVVITPLDQLETTARLDVPLLDVAGLLTLSAAGECREAARADAVDAAQAALLDVARAAWELRTAEVSLAAARAAVDTTTAVRDRAQARVDAGLGPRIDALRASGDLARAQGALVTAEADVSAARRALQATTGLDALPGALSPRALPDGALGDGVFSAEAHPQLVSAQATLDCRARTASAARLGLAPTVDAFAQARLSNATGFAGEAASWSAGATITWTPLEGGRRAAVLAGAEADRRAAEATLAQREQEVFDGLADARARLDAARSGLDAARAREEAAQAASADARARFEAGTGLAVEVSLAVDEARAAAVDLARATATHALAIETLRVAAGLPLLTSEAG